MNAVAPPGLRHLPHPPAGAILSDNCTKCPPVPIAGSEVLAMVYSNERELTYVDSRIQAQPLLDFLQQNGVDAQFTDDDDMGGLNPALAFAHGTYIAVPTEQLDHAKSLIEAFAAVPEAAPDAATGEDAE